MSKTASVFLFVVVPLLIGASLYFIFRSKDLYFFRWLRLDINIATPPFWVVYNLPDFLWLFSFSQAIRHIWKHGTSLFAWLITCFSLALISEVLQRLTIIPGTFDPFDIVAYSLALSLVLAQIIITQLITKPIAYENTH